MSDREIGFRMDFETKVVSFDEKTGTVVFEFIPNPRRYEWKMIDGKRCLYDKLDNICFSEEVFSQLADKLAGMPIYYERQEIGNAGQYVENRKIAIKTMIRENQKITTYEDKSEAFLKSLEKDKLAFVIMCVDIAGSTNLSTSLNPTKYAKLISTTLYEISEIIPKFHGHVLKYTGDGLIAYFPEPSFISKNDLAMDCALTIRRLIYHGLNLILESENYPRIDIRIGLDSGEACIIAIGSPETKQHKDIIGKVVSLASKIQTKGKPGDILLGDVTERNLHTMWREICEPVKLGEDWRYKGEDGRPYKVHMVKFR